MDQPTRLSLKAAAQLFFQADAVLDTSISRDYKGAGQLFGGTARDFNPSPVVSEVPPLTGLKYRVPIHVVGCFHCKGCGRHCSMGSTGWRGTRLGSTARRRLEHVSASEPGVARGNPMFGAYPSPSSSRPNSIEQVEWEVRETGLVRKGL